MFTIVKFTNGFNKPELFSPIGFLDFLWDGMGTALDCESEENSLDSIEDPLVQWAFNEAKKEDLGNAGLEKQIQIFKALDNFFGYNTCPENTITYEILEE